MHAIEEQPAGSVHGLGKRAGPEMCGQGPATDDVHERRMTEGIDEWRGGRDATTEGQGTRRSGVGRDAYGRDLSDERHGETIDARAAASDGGAAEWKHGALILDSLRDEGHTLVLVYELGMEERHGSRRRSRSCLAEPCSMLVCVCASVDGVHAFPCVRIFVFTCWRVPA